MRLTLVTSKEVCVWGEGRQEGQEGWEGWRGQEGGQEGWGAGGVGGQARGNQPPWAAQSRGKRPSREADESAVGVQGQGRPPCRWGAVC